MLKKFNDLSGKSLQILDVGLNSTSGEKALKFIGQKISKEQGFFLVTHNPVFIVMAQKDREFQRILNHADLSIPDGIGLIFAAKFLGLKPSIKQRITGADLVEELLKMTQDEGWKIGIVGARRGERREVRELLSRLKRKYPRLKVEALELVKNWPKRGYQLVLVAYGMGKQEKWIWENRKQVKGTGFLAIGRSLDFLTGFSQRAPEWMRKLGLEWLWRLIQEPSHIKRVYLSCVVFPWLVLKEKLRRSCPFAGCREDRGRLLFDIFGRREN